MSVKTGKYRRYQEAWESRRRKEYQELERKKELLSKKVRLCSEKLKELGGRQVILFGSLATGNFRKNSDVDIAVKGLSAHAYFKALGILEEILGDVSFDLVDMQEALPSVLRKVEREGIQL